MSEIFRRYNRKYAFKTDLNEVFAILFGREDGYFLVKAFIGSLILTLLLSKLTSDAPIVFVLRPQLQKSGKEAQRYQEAAGTGRQV